MKIDLQQLEIKRVSVVDIDTMVYHRMQYLTEMQGNHDDSKHKLLQSELKQYFLNGILSNNIIVLVALYNSVPVSYGAVVLRTVPGDFCSSTYLEGDILNMYTIPEARRQGISSLLLEKLIAEARTLGVTKLALHTTVSGEKLYRSEHFSEPAYPYLELVL